jgi:hypothetical protein
MKRQALTLWLVSAVVVASSLACTVSGMEFGGVRGSGRVVEEVREVSGFTGVELATWGDLTIEVGEKEELRIQAEDNVIEYIETRVDGDMLVIKTRPGVVLMSVEPVNLYLTVRELDTIVVAGSGDVTGPDLEADRIEVSIYGSGDVELGDLDADAVELKVVGSGDMDVASVRAREQTIRISGSGDVDVDAVQVDSVDVRIPGSGELDVFAGKAGEQSVAISGSGDYRAKEMESSQAKVRIAGSGSVTVCVRDHLDVRIGGSGDVRYAGSPTVEQSVAGSGDVTRIGG